MDTVLPETTLILTRDISLTLFTETYHTLYNRCFVCDQSEKGTKKWRLVSRPSNALPTKTAQTVHALQLYNKCPIDYKKIGLFGTVFAFYPESQSKN